MKIHTCDACGKKGEWGNGWEWWGSYASEDCGQVIKFCSRYCAKSKKPESVWLDKFGEPYNPNKFTLRKY